jgi:CBS domain-containing protein
MKVKEVMTPNPAFATAAATLEQIARMMVDHNCGAIPIVEAPQSEVLVGIITDRDITCRTLAKGRNPMGMRAQDVMSTPLVTVEPDADLEECCMTMGLNQLRRIPVVEETGKCVGIVSVADVALHAPGWEAAAVVKGISEPAKAVTSTLF